MASSQIYIFKYITAQFAPVALIRWEEWIERRMESVFTPAEIGVKLLDTLPGGAAEKMGVQPGEIIMAINSKEVMVINGWKTILKNILIIYGWILKAETGRLGLLNTRTISQV